MENNMLSFTEILLYISALCNAALIYGAYLFANPINNKRFQLWSLTRIILERFSNQITIQGKLPVSQNLHDYSKELIYEVENKLCSKGYKVSNRNNIITIE